jgi:hypothetical protein
MRDGWPFTASDEDAGRGGQNIGTLLAGRCLENRAFHMKITACSGLGSGDAPAVHLHAVVVIRIVGRICRLGSVDGLIVRVDGLIVFVDRDVLC